MSILRALFYSLLLVSFLNVMPAGAMDVDDDSTSNAEFIGPWFVNLIGRLSASQTGTQNWAEGSANTLTSTVMLESKISYKAKKWTQTHETKFAFGALKQDTLAFRKAADEIRIKSSFEYKGEGVFQKFKPTIASDISTQFAAGYNYSKNPFEGREELPAHVSHFFAPATFVQTLGLTYGEKDAFKQRVGLGAKQTIVMIEEIRPLHNMDIDQPVRFELGIESRTNFDRQIFENVRLKSSIGIFAAFNKPDLPDLLWESEVSMRVNKWLGLRVEFDALYDHDMANELQLKEALSLGFTYDLI